MKTMTVNIGLGNNPKNFEQIKVWLHSLNGYTLIDCKNLSKTFQGEKEDTFVGLIRYDYSHQSKILADVENWCLVLTQESIAISTNQMDALAFNVSAKK